MDGNIVMANSITYQSEEENAALADKYYNESIYVCDNCLMASCLQGMFMCEQAYHAGITTRTRKELIELRREHTDYMHNGEGKLSW